MRCPQNPDLQAYLDNGDPRVACHLASCAACRTELLLLQHMHSSLTGMPMLDTPQTVTHRFHQLAGEIADRQMACADTLAGLEAWREGTLDPLHSFLLEDHLLSCEACAAALASAEAVTSVLHLLPTLDAPAVIAERIERARLPWWQRLLPAPAPTVWPRVGWAMGAIAVALTTLTALTNMPGVMMASRQPVPVVEFHPEQPTRGTVIPENGNANQDRLPVAENTQVAPSPVSSTPSVKRVNVVSGVVANKIPVQKPMESKIVNPVKNGTNTVGASYVPRPNIYIESDRGPVEVAEYRYDAMDAVLNRVRDEERASIEETLSTMPKELVAVVPRNLPPAPRRAPEKENINMTPAPENTPVSDAAKRAAAAASIRESLSSKNGTPRILPTISVRNERKETHTAGVLGVTSF
ncbi:MAG: hypothetical protein ACYDBB_15780 [Armatimonadota bacterium]